MNESRGNQGQGERIQEELFVAQIHTKQYRMKKKSLQSGNTQANIYIYES